MTLQSMTGFGRQETAIGEASLAVELKSVNNKQLKLTLRCPSWLSYLEPSLEAAVKATFRRGTIYLNLNFERSESSAIQVNHERLEALMRAFSARGLNNQPLCLVPGVVEENQRQGLTDEEESHLLEGVKAAILDLEKARMREGAAVQEVLVEMMKKLDEERVGIEQHYVDHRREAEEKLKSRLDELSERDGAIGALIHSCCRVRSPCTWTELISERSSTGLNYTFPRQKKSSEREKGHGGGSSSLWLKRLVVRSIPPARSLSTFRFRKR